jgi:hypothetical protein
MRAAGLALFLMVPVFGVASGAVPPGASAPAAMKTAPLSLTGPGGSYNAAALTLNGPGGSYNAAALTLNGPGGSYSTTGITLIGPGK